MKLFDYNSSGIKWCESEYVHDKNIIEYWNTLTSIFMAEIGLYGLLLEDSSSNKYYVILIFIGLSSAYFHATLSLMGQYLDELGISLMIMLGIYKLYKFKLKNDLINFKLVMAFGFTQLLIQFTYSTMNRFFLFLYAILFINKFHVLLFIENTRIKNYAMASLILFTISVVCWICDFVLCDDIPINFHAIWHILIGITSYVLIKTFSIYTQYLNSKESKETTNREIGKNVSFNV